MITSKENSKVKHLKKLSNKKYRDETGEFLIFGEHLIEEAEKHSKIKELYTTNNEKKGLLITKSIMSHISPLKSITERVAIVDKLNIKFESNKVLILEDVQNPNNVGALLRSASAFGFKKVILSNRCADIYNEKTISASKGAIFHLDITRTDIYEEIKKLKKDGYHVIATSLTAKGSSSYENKIALVLGNEGQGISDKARNLADSFQMIKTETVESLNVVVAGSILMYEWSLR